MNNIYKVIWSKAKNCYVVASEIARSHTKSATGSEKIGGVTRRSILASLMALSLLCWGFGVATAADGSVHVEDIASTATSKEVYTAGKVDTLLADYGKKTDVETNKNDIATLNTTTTNQGNQITANTTNIANNTAAIAKKADVTALGEYAKTVDVNTELAKKADAANVYTKTEADTKLADYAKTADVNTALAGKADKATTLAGYGINDAYTKGEVDNALNNKADKATTLAGYGIADAYTKGEVDNALNNKADKATTLAGYGITDAYTKAEVNTAVANAVTTAGNNVDTKLAAYAKTTDVYNKAEVDGKITAEANARTAAITAAIAQERNDRDAAINTAINGEVTNRNQAIHDAIAQEVTDRNAAVTNAKTELQNKITAEETARTNADTAFNNRLTTAEGKIDANKIAIGDLKAKDTELEGKITTLEGSGVKYDTAVKDKITLAGTGGTTITNLKDAALNESSTDAVTGKQLNKTNENLAAEVTARTNKDAELEGKITKNSQDITKLKEKDTELEGKIQTNANNIQANANDIAATNKRTAGIKRNDATNETTIEGNVTVDNLGNVKAKGDVTADGKLTVTGDADLKNTQVDGTLGVNKETTLNGTLTAKGEAIFEKDVTVKGTTNLKNTTVDGNLKVAGTITTDKMIFGDPATNNYTEIDKGKVTSKNLVVNGAGETISSSSTFDVEKNEVGFTNTATGDHSYHKQTAKGINGYVTDKDGNKTYTKVTATENSFQVQDKDGKNKNHQVNTKDSSVTEITNGDGKTTKTEQTATDITNTAKDGTITNDANHIVNKANTMDTTVTGKATESYGELETTVNGKETHTVTGNQDIHVTGKQTNTVGGGQENIISGGQTNTITGGQTNNITGDQTTTITGNKKETVTENVTEDYQKDLTTTVGGNENHEVKGTKTETVEGKVTENFKNGQETNVTGDQVIKVSGTQTTTATDINRNASSGMIDTIDNDYGTNTETKVAGKTTTDVSIKGTGEKGQYIRGANESRDYLIKGTLKNSETKTAEATSTEITDGTNKASTIQDAKNLAGSVTNGTETGVSGIHANNDGSVSIDSSVAGGGMSSVINQKKDSIQSAVGDGTNSTVIHQDKDNVTIASSNGMVGLVGKDIVNNAQNTITNTAGTSITNQVKDSKVTTDANGTTFENNTPAVSDGGTTTTKINGNHINTGRVDANELGVSDKDGANTADLSVKAGEGVKASAGNGTTTGSLDVKADEVVSSVKDADGKGSTFKQRIDAIMMESKNVSIKAEETLTNDAKDIVTNASHSITEKVGENNVTTKTTTSSKSEIQNADTITSVQQTEDMVQSYVGKKDGSATNVTTNFANASANKVTENGQSSTVLNNKDGLLIQNTANGNSFTTADGTNTGTAQGWTNVKGNEISTGKVEANYVKMDYADVMKDLGVRGNANITGKTTTGSLEVTGTSTLKGDVTMGSNAIVKKDLTVEGNTNLKNTKVDGTLDVTQKATFGDSVSIAKDLSAGGNATIKGDVTAKSYKVGDKTYISAAGINANDQKITNVADGSISEGSKDAVNGGQLYGVKRDLEHQVNKVGANAAAMANLRPMEFDPSSKWNIAAAIGNYGSETAAALGAFYRPNDDVMVNLSTAFGTGENMVGGGVSVRLGKGSNKLSREENNALKAQVDDLTARMDALLSVLNPNMSKDFPDVPENHWAYEAVSRLAGNDIVQGYPDGEFHGERTMTRYEMAEIIYNALSRGAEAEKELVEEFKPELQAMAASEKATAERATAERAEG